MAAEARWQAAAAWHAADEAACVATAVATGPHLAPSVAAWRAAHAAYGAWARAAEAAGVAEGAGTTVALGVTSHMHAGKRAAVEAVAAGVASSAAAIRADAWRPSGNGNHAGAAWQKAAERAATAWRLATSASNRAIDEGAKAAEAAATGGDPDEPEYLAARFAFAAGAEGAEPTDGR